MNSVALTGRLTREIDLRYGGQDNNTAVAHFTLAVDAYKDTAFISCVAFGKQAEWLSKWTNKGTKIELLGMIRTGSYNNRENQKVYYTEVMANSVSFGESKAETEERQKNGGSGSRDSRQQTDAGDGFMNIPDGIDEELPFT